MTGQDFGLPVEKLLDLSHHGSAVTLFFLVSPNKCENVPHGCALLPPIGETEADVTSVMSDLLLT